MALNETPPTAQQVGGVPALPLEGCTTPARDTWSQPEKWVWEQVCRGEIADFNDRYGDLDPASYPMWTENRKIRSSFLETILLHEPYRSALPRQGVHIKGAWVREGIDLKCAVLRHQLSLEGSRIDKDVDLTFLRTDSNISFSGSVVCYGSKVNMEGAKIGGHLDMDGAQCTGKLTMDLLEVGGNLLLRRGAKLSEVILRGAKIDGQLNMMGSKCTGALDMNQLVVNGSLHMRYLKEFSKIDLITAKVRGDFNMKDATCTGELKMHSLEVGGNLYMDRAELVEVDMRGAKVGGELSMVEAKCKGTLDMNSIEVGGHLIMHKGAEFSAVDLTFADIDGNLDISATTFESLNLTGTGVKRELRLGSYPWYKPIWSGDCPRLQLRNTVVSAIQAPDDPDAFPNNLELEGFRYTRLGGQVDPGTEEMGSRGTDFFTKWLKKDETFSPQPYLQLAEVLRAMGHPQTADDILYEGKERERKEVSKRSRWIGLTLLKEVIGYGYGPGRYFKSLKWVGFFTIFGAIVYATTQCKPLNFGTWSFCLFLCKPWSFFHPLLPIIKSIISPETLAFSLDLLLPIVKLNEHHSKILQTLPDYARYYFYVHELIGYVLGSCVAAGLSGITKK